MEACLAFGVPDGPPLFAAEVWVVSFALILIPDGIADTSSISGRLVAESAIISELIGAILPADGAHSVKALAANRIAESPILFLTFSASCNNLTYTSSVGILPAV
jgi:hypothetical protein